MSKTIEAIELLRCAEINCDNVSRVGMFMVELVKAQIQEAIKLLGDDDENDK